MTNIRERTQTKAVLHKALGFLQQHWRPLIGASKWRDKGGLKNPAAARRFGVSLAAVLVTLLKDSKTFLTASVQVKPSSCNATLSPASSWPIKLSYNDGCRAKMAAHGPSDVANLVLGQGESTSTSTS
jgi:hypothetical protein